MLTSTKWARALTNLGVSLPVALAPLLGRAHVPGFTSLLSLIPEALQNFAVAIGAASMSLVAASVEFRAIANASRARLQRAAKKATLVAALLLVCLALAYSHLVTRVSYDFESKHRSYVTGIEYPKKPPCEDDLTGRDDCVKRLQMQDGAVRAYFGEEQVGYSTDFLVGSYAGFLAAFGNLVGILVTIQRKHAA